MVVVKVMANHNSKAEGSSDNWFLWHLELCLHPLFVDEKTGDSKPPTRPVHSGNRLVDSSFPDTPVFVLFCCLAKADLDVIERFSSSPLSILYPPRTTFLSRSSAFSRPLFDVWAECKVLQGRESRGVPEQTVASTGSFLIRRLVTSRSKLR